MAIPLIGVTSSYHPTQDGKTAANVVGEAYLQAVLNAGGAPVILPAELPEEEFSGLFSRLDGFLFTGGSDVDPARFGGVPHPRVYGIDPERDGTEIALVRLAAETGRPFLGICRGIQVINVALGGSLYTDVADQLAGARKHDHYPDSPRDFLAHRVSVTPDSRLAAILDGVDVAVNSMHHQGAERIAPGLTATAYAPDGLVEAVELPGHPFGLGVQWHPECLQAYPPQRSLFTALVKAALAR